MKKKIVFVFYLIIYIFSQPLMGVCSLNYKKQFVNKASIIPGGTIKLDYRNISDQARADSRFDIRQARIFIKGEVKPLLKYKFEYELQGNETKKLIDAFGEFKFNHLLFFKLGQFKTPYSFEWQINDGNFCFAERSIGFSLQPGRDIGLMMGGDIFKKSISYKLGIFNGDGIDGSSRGNQRDDPEMIARVVIKPLAFTNIFFLSSIFSGLSVSESKIDLTNVNIKAKSTGMIGTQRSLYILRSTTKFGALLDVNKRKRINIEGGFTHGPIAVFGEYQRFKYTDLKPVNEKSANSNFYSWYACLVANLTGEKIMIKDGNLYPVVTKKDQMNQSYFSRKISNFSNKIGSPIWQSGLRLEHFSGDSNWIKHKAFNSSKEADAYSIAINCIFYPFLRLMLDYTYTDISDPIRIRVNPNATIDYMKSETAVTFRCLIIF